MHTVKINGMTIGEGRPWIIAPVIGKTSDEILSSISRIDANPYVEMIEWRADYYENVLNPIELNKTLCSIHKVLKRLPYIFTFRTAEENGNRLITPEDYIELLSNVAQSGFVDIIDVQMFFHGVSEECVKRIHAARRYVMGTYHEFTMTPPKNEIIDRMISMQKMGADIITVAVMPQSKSDVLTLMTASNEMYEKYADRPIVAISMSPLGVVSRLACEMIGSSMTFGSISDTSASGQIPVEQLNSALNIIHSYL